MATIKEFQGQYRWLSNFWSVDIVCFGHTFPSVEHAYCFAKSYNPDWRTMCLDRELPPGAIKRAGRNITLRKDWDHVREEVMETCLRGKFSNPEMRSNLLATGDANIYEGNTWNDHFWGVDLYTGYGQNKLGKLLMKLLMKLRAEYKKD